MAHIEIHRKPKKYGQLHPSGKNRHERRQEEAILRRAPMIEKRRRAELHHEWLRDQKAAKVKRRQDAAHKRALERKGKVTPGFISRSKAKMVAMRQRQTEARREKQRRWKVKHAV